jgi:hypothetical protein
VKAGGWKVRWGVSVWRPNPRNPYPWRYARRRKIRYGPLSLEALLDLFWRPTAGPKALLLCGGGTGDTDRRVQLGFGFSFKEERDHDDCERPARRAPSLDLSVPECPDAWMQDVFELPASGGVGKNAACQFIAAQLAVRPGELGAEGCQHFSQRRLARLNDLARQVVSVHHRNPARTEELGRGGLAHANATG